PATRSPEPASRPVVDDRGAEVLGDVERVGMVLRVVLTALVGRLRRLAVPQDDPAAVPGLAVQQVGALASGRVAGPDAGLGAVLGAEFLVEVEHQPAVLVEAPDQDREGVAEDAAVAQLQRTAPAVLDGRR